METRILCVQEKINQALKAKKQMRKASEYINNIQNGNYDLTKDEKNDLMYMIIQLSNMKKTQNMILNKHYSKVGYYNVSKN